MFTISWHFKLHKVTLWHWCMASATQSFEKAHSILSFTCAPAYAISTWKNIANKKDASPGVFLCRNQIWIIPWPLFSPVPRLCYVQWAIKAAPAVLEGMEFLFLQCSHMVFTHSGAHGWIGSVHLLFSLKSLLFIFKYFQSAHPHWLFGA